MQLWLEAGKIRILYVNRFEESSSNSSWPPDELTVASKLRHRPPAPRNVGMPDSADMPAPDNTVTFCITDSYP
jgi:hypothetical protein